MHNLIPMLAAMGCITPEAEMAIIGMFLQDGLTGFAWGDWALDTASPLRNKSHCRCRVSCGEHSATAGATGDVGIPVGALRKAGLVKQ